MKALVVYESIFGNTKQVAEAIGRGLSRAFEVKVVEVGSADADANGVDLIVVGGPTHVFSMSRPSTRDTGREQAAKQSIEPVSKDIGVREWLDRVEGSNGVMAAAFDTGMGKLGIFPAGSAAKGEAKYLAAKGFRVIARPEQFLVATEGERTFLIDGELERARKWGEELAASVTVH